MHLLRLQWLHSMDDQPAEARLPSAEESRPIPEDAPWERGSHGHGGGGGILSQIVENMEKWNSRRKLRFPNATFLENSTIWDRYNDGILEESCVWKAQLSSRIPFFPFFPFFEIESTPSSF